MKHVRIDCRVCGREQEVTASEEDNALTFEEARNLGWREADGFVVSSSFGWFCPEHSKWR